MRNVWCSINFSGMNIFSRKKEKAIHGISCRLYFLYQTLCIFYTCKKKNSPNNSCSYHDMSLILFTFFRRKFSFSVCFSFVQFDFDFFDGGVS